MPYSSLFLIGKSPRHLNMIYCRVCLCKQHRDSSHYRDIFQEWTSNYYTIHQNTTTIAKEMTKVTNVEFSIDDGHSRYICKKCYKNLSITLKFIYDVRNSASALAKGLNEVTKSIELWPKPIQLDKNINEEVFGTSQEVEIKQEVVSDDDEMNYSNRSTPGSIQLDIKVEPEEITESMPFQITVNGTITEEQHERIASLSNGCGTYENVEYLVKDEPWSDEDIQPECMLCTKDFKTLAGLRAHVLAEHNYKGVKRKTNNTPSPEKRNSDSKKTSTETKYSCATCRRTFTTSTDLKVHEVCHSEHCCYACNTKFDSFKELAKHRRHCSIGKNVVVKPKTLKDAMRERAEIKIKPPADLTLSCLQCGIKFCDLLYLKMHNSIDHANNVNECGNSITVNVSEDNKDKEDDTVENREPDKELTTKEKNNETCKETMTKTETKQDKQKSAENSDPINELETENRTSELATVIKQEEPDLQESKNNDISDKDEHSAMEINVESIFEYAVAKQPISKKSENNIKEYDKVTSGVDGKVEKEIAQEQPNSDATEIFIEVDLDQKYAFEKAMQVQVIKNDDQDLRESTQMTRVIGNKRKNEQAEPLAIERKHAKLLLVEMQETSEYESENLSSTDDIESENCLEDSNIKGNSKLLDNKLQNNNDRKANADAIVKENSLTSDSLNKPSASDSEIEQNNVMCKDSVTVQTFRSC